MSKFDEKFGFKEDKGADDFHRGRRMFVVKDGELIIAEPNLPYSHPSWFEKEGWMSEGDDRFIKESVRGAVMKDGEVRFYVGWDFQINVEAEQQFIPHLKELVDNLALDTSASLSGGQIKDERFRPRRQYGAIKENFRQ